MKFVKYVVTWTEQREVEVFAKSEDDAIDNAEHMTGNVLQKDMFCAKEAKRNTERGYDE